jgi:hypothetical protein
MTGPNKTDCCPACGGDEAIPFALLFGAVELYGYQCPCGQAWLTLPAPTPSGTPAVHKLKDPAA